MIDVSATRIIDAPVGEVFEFMTRVENLPNWLVGCVEAWPTSEDPYRVGGTVAHIDEVMGQRFEAHYEVVEWEPCGCLVFQTISGGPFEGRSELRFEDMGDRTRVDVRISGELKSVLKIGDWVAKRVAQKQLKESVDNAERMIEGNQG